MNALSRVYMIPSLLAPDAVCTIPDYVLDTIRTCQVLFVENERTARRFLKSLDKQISIDGFEWHTIHKTEEKAEPAFRKCIDEGKIAGILSEAGCPGIADPGQRLVALAQQWGVPVIPLVGPNAILLALMASGMNGQQFRFRGYLPIDAHGRQQMIREMESESARTDCTQIFIETPYRNNSLLSFLAKSCQPNTRLCIAVNITGKEESIRTMSIAEWKLAMPDLDKKPAIFLIHR